MSARLTILASVKALLRARNMPYRDLARAIKVSEATIKRDLSRGTFSLALASAISSRRPTAASWSQNSRKPRRSHLRVTRGLWW
jgi:IS30 family transposase